MAPSAVETVPLVVPATETVVAPQIQTQVSLAGKVIASTHIPPIIPPLKIKLANTLQSPAQIAESDSG